MKTHNISNFSFDSILGNHAKNQFKLWNFSKEWRIGIIILSLLKGATMIISIYAGYYFLYNISLPVLQNTQITTITTSILLILIELLTMVFLQKFFKFLFKGIIVTAIFAAIVAASIYSVSFYMSTNGLAMRQAAKIDNTKSIVDNTKIESMKIYSKYESKIKNLKSEIKTIKSNPNGWIDGKPKRLTLSQLNDIKFYNLMIDSLDKQIKTENSLLLKKQKNKLFSNKQKTTAEASKYYKFIIAIMAAQLIFNALLMLSWSRIYIENDKLASVNEDIAKAENTIIENFFAHIANRLFEEANNIQTSIENQKQLSFEINNQQAVQEVPTSSNIGFKPSSNKHQTESNKHILGKLKTNDMLRYVLQQKESGNIDWTEKKIKDECNVRKWKIYEFKNMMITAGIIKEPVKYNK